MRAGASVLMTADTVGGVLTYALDLAHALSEHGIRVALATMGGPMPRARRAEADRTPGLTVIEGEYRLEWMDEPWGDVARAGDWLLALEARFEPSIIHVNGLAHAALPFRAPKVAAVHSSVTSWWRAVHGEEAPARYDRYRREARRGLAAAGMVIAPTRAMLAAAEDDHGPFARSRVIANGADPKRFRPGPKEDIILSGGRLWDEAKNAASLARLAPRLPFPVVMMGSEAHPDHGERPLPGVTRLGLLSGDDLAAWMSRAAIYALPARYEPFGLSILEAALSGAALVLGDIPSLRELWEGAALFAPPNDDEAIERAIRRLTDDADGRRRMAVAARARALEFTPDRVAVATIDVYDELLRGGIGIGGSRGARCA